MNSCVIVLGLPGSGKSTQGALLSQKLGIPHIDAGTSIKKYIEILKNESSNEVQTVIEGFRKGPQNPTELLFKSLEIALSKIDLSHGLVLTQNMASVEELYNEQIFLSKFNLKISRVFALTITRDSAIKRMVKRLNGKFTEKEPDIQSLESRFDNYVPQFAVVVEELDKIGILTVIDGEREMTTIFDDIYTKTKAKR